MTQSKPVQNKSVQKNRTQKKIEGIYPLSPSQQGMLWDTLASQHSQPVLTAEETADQDNSGSKYIEISVYELNGALNVAHFQQAWQSVIARHSILRAGYVWEGQAEPLQFVLRQLTIALDYRDQRELSATAQAAALANYMAEERATGFDLTKPPLLRLALFQLAEERYHFVLTIHHILIDGWSLPLLLHDVVAWYEAHRAGTQAQLPTVPPYQSYIRWLKSQDVDAAAKFWQAYLQGIARPTPLGIVREDLTEDVTTETPVTQVVTERYQCVEQTLDTVTTARLQDIAKQERLVLNTFLRGIWAILLHRYSGQADVLFGATISGRPATLPDAGAIVGLFINTVPIRIQVTAEQPLLEWLQPLQRTAHDVEEQGYCSNGQIHSWSAVPGSLPLFESILVFQNYSVAGFEAQVADASIDVARVSSSGAHTPYALTIMVKQDMIKRAEREELDHGLQIELIYDTKRFQRAAIEQILAHWLLLLQAIAEDPHQSVETLLAQIPVAQIPQVAPLLQTHHAKRYATASTDREAQLVKLWEEVLGTAPVGIHDNFFDLGGHSLLLVKLRQRLQDELGQEIKIVDLFTYPTIAALSQHLFPMAQATAETEVFATETNTSGRTQGQSIQSSDDIAIVGMAGRFPGAASVTEFWQRIAQGEELITFFTPEELAAAGVPEALRNDPNYVPANGILAGFDRFDAAFFGIPPREAKELNPQHRLFLETVWTAIEDAGYDLQRYPGEIGLYAGGGMNTYNRQGYHGLTTSEDMTADFKEAINGDREFLATRVSYKLNLRGPSVTVHAACSTSLVAVHLACQSLRSGECDMAAAGGVSVSFFADEGYLYQEGMIASPDGHCRAFDAKAGGTVAGNGMGVVLCKRLQDALADGDVIHAVIKGTAINNDGADKVGYTAPSVHGQAAVITQAHANAGIDASTISYVEAHGTGTALGDPMEVAALKQVFNRHPQREMPCAIGSVKPNIGHLGEAAGVAGLIKTVLALKQQQLPPTLHFTTPNPELGLEDSPFYVNTELQPWSQGQQPRRAGVSSFGIGGTNAHVIVEEAPAVAEETARVDGAIPEPTPTHHLLTLSAKSDAALDALVERYVDFLADTPTADLAQICYTTHLGRSHFAKRLAITAATKSELQEKLAAAQAQQATMGVSRGQVASPTPPRIAFLFTGQGAQYLGMGRELYATDPTFRSLLEECDLHLQRHLGQSVLAILFPGERSTAKSDHTDESTKELLDQTRYTQPALFILEYALAKLWQSWGIQPTVVMGHSIGEIVAACLAGVFTLEDALKLVAARGNLMSTLPAGGTMVAVRATENVVQAALAPYADQVAIAAINGPQSLVISGAEEAITAVVAALETDGVRTRPLKVSHAFHSPLMEPMFAEFAKVAQTISYHPPQIDLVSNVTGELISAHSANPAGSLTDWRYWVEHVRQPVRFAAGVATLYAQRCDLFLEIGPKPTLVSMARQIPQPETTAQPVTMIPSLGQGRSNWQQLLEALGILYLHNAPIAWAALTPPSARRKVTLPTYPFQGKRYWKDDAVPASTVHQSTGNNGIGLDAMKEWLGGASPEQITQLLLETGQLPGVIGQLVTQLLMGAGGTLSALQSSPAAQPVSGNGINGRHYANVADGTNTNHGGNGHVAAGSQTAIEAVTMPVENIREQLSHTPSATHQSVLTSWLQTNVAQILGYGTYTGEEFEPHLGPGSVGMDSLLVLDLRTRIESALGVAIPIALLLTASFAEIAVAIQEGLPTEADAVVTNS